MTGLVEYIAKSLVDHPEKVLVSGEQNTEGEAITLQVSAEDMGKVIGKKGRIAKALRTVVKAAALRDNRNVSVEIISDEEAQEAEVKADEVTE